MRTTTAVLAAMVLSSSHFSAAGAQEQRARTLFVAPFSAEAGPNMASEVTARVRASLSAVEGIEVGDWDAIVDQFLRARHLEAGALEPWSCVRARQVAAAQHIGLLLCGVITAIPTGFRVALQVVDVSRGVSTDLDAGVARDQEGLVDHARAAVADWYRRRGG